MNDSKSKEIKESQRGKRIDSDALQRWRRASHAIRPSSRIGPLFGLTFRDLEKSAERVAALSTGFPPYTPRLKRIFDIVLASLALVLLLPIIAAVMVTIRVESRGPVFYSAERVGLNRRPFPMIKFRTMKVGSDQQILELSNALGAGVLMKLSRDPRITPVGHFLRKHSLDDLPKLVNVIKGDMSIVGPRPLLEREAESAKDRPEMLQIFRMRPGITGPWERSARDDKSWEHAIQCDISYVGNWSFMNDIRLLVIYLWYCIRGAH